MRGKLRYRSKKRDCSREKQRNKETCREKKKDRKYRSRVIKGKTIKWKGNGGRTTRIEINIDETKSYTIEIATDVNGDNEIQMTLLILRTEC